ncbi:uncharacterized protein LOC141630185 [Silene latifolia]|uniref:uncharacterized protein LOC141630185 n=1 Tax=Silene latifolia TaxID=37657 RepID=UPI003D783751
MVTKRGIEASLEQTILELESPKSVKDIQRLTGRVATLNRFISKSSKRCRSFYDLLRKNKSFKWMPEHKTPFQELKNYLATTPLLAKPNQGEPLTVYLSITETAISGVLAKEVEGQLHLVYYVSKSLLDAKTRKPEHSGRMAKWSVQLSTYDITFEPRTRIKSQTLEDFVADFSPNLELDLIKEVNQLDTQKSGQEWTLHVDGATNMRGIGLGRVLKSPQGDLIAQAVSCEFKASNNEVEYEALIAEL